jgi:hypothetical protein
MRTQTWAQLFLSAADNLRIRDFLASETGIRTSVRRRRRLTVYYALGPMLGIVPFGPRTGNAEYRR